MELREAQIRSTTDRRKRRGSQGELGARASLRAAKRFAREHRRVRQDGLKVDRELGPGRSERGRAGRATPNSRSRLARAARQSSKPPAPDCPDSADAGQQFGAQAIAARARLGATVSTAISSQSCHGSCRRELDHQEIPTRQPFGRQTGNLDREDWFRPPGELGRYRRAGSSPLHQGEERRGRGSLQRRWTASSCEKVAAMSERISSCAPSSDRGVRIRKTRRTGAPSGVSNSMPLGETPTATTGRARPTSRACGAATPPPRAVETSCSRSKTAAVTRASSRPVARAETRTSSRIACIGARALREARRSGRG